MKRTTAPFSPRIRATLGFTLIEALAAITLMGIVLGTIATITGQWLPKWDRGFARAQRAETIGMALERLVADISAAQFIPPNRDSKQPLFDGTETAVTFVRTAVGPNTRPGLDVIRISETADDRGRVLVRWRTPFAPGPGVRSDFADPVALIRVPYRVSFEYGDPDGVFRGVWQNADTLPAAVRLIVRDTATGRALSASTATLIHAQLPATAACGGGNAGGAGGTGGAAGAGGAAGVGGSAGAAGAAGLGGSAGAAGAAGLGGSAGAAGAAGVGGSAGAAGAAGAGAACGEQADAPNNAGPVRGRNE
jgi:general secretion pathway protein J